eukprot:4763285-Pyramimonas_sp.AAC.1
MEFNSSGCEALADGAARRAPFCRGHRHLEEAPAGFLTDWRGAFPDRGGLEDDEGGAQAAWLAGRRDLLP